MVTRTRRTISADRAVVAQVEEAAQLAAKLTKVLESLGKREGPLSKDVAWTLERTARELGSTYGYGLQQGGMSFTRALERATDELGICAQTRVDSDVLKVTHGVVSGFSFFDPTARRQTTERDKLLARFMAAHPQITVAAHSTPWGARDAFSIDGEKRHRVAFVQDPRWPKLQRALQDIYDAEGAPAGEGGRPARKIPDAMKFVFGA